ncbi:MAG: cysteine synthase B [Flammeovirgaceae bacterium]|nr:cysteine synthase B [Flammeovirgaceae bacterium]MBE61928.1 cysteine synthase B [Flammeovirgaceae bacterium]MBR08733.1 cysteine synthase B [Rickettsiales bacterium]HCX23296.1 cysteine synthase B [Cytophagales bacterium]|tara:strand:+ start:6926 stop:7804 length:879 start_codon:yes stop_codon:yes gene_type:complete
MKLFDLIGNTPLVEITRINKNPNVKIFGKLEGQNPGGSVKDRAAYGMITEALKRGDIKTGDKLVEATSGNTGIALAMIAQSAGLKMTLLMPENSTKERVQAMRAYGAEVILTPAEKTIEYSRELAEEMATNQGYFMLNQFANPDNYGMHYKTTGPEIWKDTNGQVTHFVSAMGTTGTIMGVSKYLKEQNSNIQIVGTQPTEGSSIPGIRRWSPEFLPKIFDPSRVDRVIDVSEDNARLMARRLAKEEAILSGMSSGGALTAALELASELDEGVIVFIVCDTGERYLSMSLFD